MMLLQRVFFLVHYFFRDRVSSSKELSGDLRFSTQQVENLSQEDESYTEGS